MDRKSWERAKRVVADALEASPAQRQRIVDAACGDDDVLAAIVRSLLTAHDEAGAFLEGPAIVSETEGRLSGSDELLAARGSTIGPYELVEPLGEGGMGAVWLARQSEPVTRSVALKIIKVGMDTRRVIARFESERRALALMDHPNIATVLDAGSTSTGRPYFVMELIDGAPLTRYADENRLSVSERIHLFLDVCSAVEHAHQKGVIHRDIKPSNLLVTLKSGRPHTKVIDFGIAKAISGSLGHGSLHTRTGQVLGTPDYASPEQAGEGDVDVDTRSDIYSLGVVLYELLTGSLPYETGPGQGFVFSSALLEREPPRPSRQLSRSDTQVTAARARGTSVRGLGRALKGDLDWIVLKAIAKDRTRRYPTASALAGDLRAYLESEPVLARPPSAAYRLQKAVRRNRSAAAAVVVALTATLLGTAASIAGFAAAREEARMAASRELAAASLEVRPHDGTLSLLLAVEAAETAPTAQAEDALQHALDPRHAPPIRGASGTIYSLGWFEADASREHTRDPGSLRVVTARARTDRDVPHGGWGTLDDLFDSTSVTMWEAAVGSSVLTAVTPITGLAAIAPAARWRASVSFGGFLRIGRGGEDSLVLSEERDLIDASFSPDETLLATAAADGTVKLWDTESWTQTLRIESRRTETLRHLSFSPGGRLLIAGDRVFDTSTGGEAMSFGDRVNQVAWSRDGSRVATASLDGSAAVWDSGTGAEILTIVGTRVPVTHVAFSPDDRWLAVARANGDVETWDIQSALRDPAWHVRDHVGGPAGPTSHHARIAFGPDGERVAVAAAAWATVWDIATASPLGRLSRARAGDGLDADLQFGPDGKLAIRTGDGVQLWDPADGSVEPLTTWSIGYVNDVPFSWQGTLVATGGHDGAVRVWDSATTSLLLEVPLPRWCSFIPCSVRGGDSVLDVELSEDGERLAAASGRHVTAWSFPTGRRLLSVDAFRSDAFVDVALSPDGTRMATAGDSVRLWNVSTGERLHSLEARARRVAFDPSGERVVTVGPDGAARLWDAIEGRPLLALAERALADERVTDAAFSPDGRRLATVTADRTVRLYPNGIDALLDAAREQRRRALTDAECRRYLYVDRCPSPDTPWTRAIAYGSPSFFARAMDMVVSVLERTW